MPRNLKNRGVSKNPQVSLNFGEKWRNTSKSKNRKYVPPHPPQIYNSALDSSTSTKPEARSKPKTRTNARIKKEKDGEFQEFYARYPRKVGQDRAERAYLKARQKASAAEILTGLEVQLPDLSTREPGYCPHPSTWLNGGHWKDELPAPRKGSLQEAADRSANVIKAIQAKTREERPSHDA